MDREPRDTSRNRNRTVWVPFPPYRGPANREIRFTSTPPSTPSSTSTSSALASSSPQSLNLRLHPHRPTEFKTTFENYVMHLNSTNLPNDGAISAAASALAKKLYLDNHRLLSVLVIDTALIPSTTIGSPPPRPAYPPETNGDALAHNVYHFYDRTCFRTFFILKKKSYAVHLFYHLKVTFEFDYSAEKFRGPDAPINPDIFSHSIVEPEVTVFTFIEGNGRNYVRKLEFNPGPSME